MNDQIKKYLTDIIFSISEIESFIGEKRSFKKFEKSSLLRSAVERKIEIIGEAVNQLLKIDPDITITNARRIVNTRNKIIHGYDEVLIWEIAIKHLPILKIEANALLTQLPS